MMRMHVQFSCLSAQSPRKHRHDLLWRSAYARPLKRRWLSPLQVYHTKRMQRVFAVRFSGDASYVFSGSDDMNVRMWKVRKSAAI
jgi:WD40 repeat protein